MAGKRTKAGRRGSFREHCARVHVLAGGGALRVTRDVLRALAELHRHGRLLSLPDDAVVEYVPLSPRGGA